MKTTRSFQSHVFTASLLGLSVLLMFVAPSVFAQAYYWDNVAGAGFGTAGGTWSATTAGPIPGWNTDSTGTAAPGSVTTATTDTSENFGSPTAALAAGTVTVSGTVSSGPIFFETNSGVIVLSGGTITLPPTATITASNAADTISSVLAGAATSLTYYGTNSAATNTLTLSGANTFGGPLTINGGRVSANATAIPAGVAVTVNNGGQLYLNTAYLANNNITISGKGYFDSIGNYDGAIRLVNGATLTGTTTLNTSSGGLTYIGFVTTTAGIYSETISGQINGTGPVSFQGLYGGTTSGSGVAATNTVILANTGTANNYTGNTYIDNNYTANAGSGGPDNTILKLGASEQIPNGPGMGVLVFDAFNTANANRACTFELNGYNETVNGITNSTVGGLGNIIQNTGAGNSILTIGDGDTTSSFNGNILDGGTGKTLAIKKIGIGTLALSGTNSYVGGTTNNAGTLEADSSTALGAGLLVMNGGALSNNVSATLTNTINLAVASSVGVGSGQTFTLGSLITNAGSLNMVGAGTLVLSNASNNYSGGTSIAGTLSLKNTSGLGTGTLTVNTGGVAYNFSSTAATITNAVSLNGGQLHTGGGNSGTKNTWSGPVTLTANSSVSSDGGTTGNTFTGGLNIGNSGYTFTVGGNGNGSGSDNNFNSVISGGPNALFITTSAGVAHLNAANTYSGTNRSAYSIVLQNVNAMQNATLDMNTNDTGSVTLINNAVIGALTGGRNLNLSVSSISIGNNNASTTFSGALTNTGSITKIGTGTLTLTSAINCTNGLIISAGTLALSGTATIANTNITVAGGATFDVSALSSTFALASGQALANSGAVTATLNGSADARSSKVALNYASGTSSLQVNSGTLTLSGSTTFTVTNNGSILLAGPYTIIKANGGSVTASTLPSVAVVGNGAVGLSSLSIDGSGNLILTVQNTGWSGAVNTSWLTPGNWSSGTVPNPGDPINFNSSSTAHLSTVLNANFGISTLNVVNPTGAVSIAPGGAYTLSITNGINLASATQDLTITAPVALGSSQTWSVTNTHTLIVNGGVSGSAALLISGGGKVSLGGAATYTGDTTVSAGGTLLMGAANVLPNGTGTGNMYVFGTLNLNGGNAESVNALNGSGILDNTGGSTATLTVGNNNASNTNFTGVIQNSSGTLSLVMAGTGALTLGGTNTYGGGTTINGGVIYPGNGSVYGTGAVTVNSGAATFALASMAFTNAFDLNGGTLHIGGGGNHQNTYSGPVSVTANSTITADGGTGYSGYPYTYGAAITISGALNMGSSGNILTNYGGNYGINLSGNISGVNGTIIDTANYLWLAGSNSFAGTIRSSSGTVINSSANGLLYATVDMNTTDSGSFTFFTYPCTIGGLMGSRNLTLAGAMSIGENDTSTTYSGNLTNSGSIAKIGTGTLTLAGANNFTNGLIINSGTLALSGSGSLASSLISIAGSATFDTSAASFTLGAGQVLSNSTSAMANIVGLLSSGSGTISMSFVNGTPSFNVTGGALNLSAMTVVAVNNMGATLTPGTYKIISKSGSGSVSGTAPTAVAVVNGPTAGTPTVSIVGGELYLTVGGTSSFSYINASFNYNGYGQSPAISFSGSTAARTTNYVGVSVSYGPTANTPTNAGTYYVSNTVAADANYLEINSSQAFTINPASASVTANPQTKLYGINNPALTATVVGQVSGGDTISYSLTTDATQFSDVGVSNIFVNLGSNPNYNVLATNSTLTITAATAAFSGLSCLTNSYGVANIILTGTVSAVGSAYPASGETVSATINGFTVSGMVNDGMGDFSITYNDPSLATNGVGGSPFTIIFNYPGNGSLSAVTDSSTSLTITNTPLLVTANDDSKMYDGSGYTGGNGVTYSGFVNGETNTVLGGALTYGGTSQNATNAGTYTIVPSGLTSTNYAISYTNGTLAVNSASISIGVSSTMNPSGYKDAISFIATLPADASGSVVFSTGGGVISANSISSGSASSSSITNLLRGTNVITVAYLGDSNYVGSTNMLDQTVTNHPPVANNASYTRNEAVNSFKILVSDLLTNAMDVDGDSLTLGLVGATTNNATITISNGYVMYCNTNAVADQFSYTVNDGYGGTNSATVMINIDTTPLFGQSQVVSTSGGAATLSFAGIPTYSYSVNRSTNLTDWATIWTTNAPVGGVFQFIDSSAPTPNAFYQLQYNP